MHSSQRVMGVSGQTTRFFTQLGLKCPSDIRRHRKCCDSEGPVEDSNHMKFQTLMTDR